jgi:hypothetical protein
MTASYSRRTETVRPEWRDNKWGIELNRSMVLAGGNGVNPFGEVLAGTLLELEDDGKVRPLVMQSLVAAVSASADVEVGDASNIYAGDEVDFAAVTDIFGTLQIVCGAGTDEILFVGKVAGQDYTIELNDPGGDGALSLAVTLGSTIHVVVTLAYGGGAVTSTVADVVNLINDSAATPHMSAANAVGTGTDLAIDVAEDALEGAALAGERVYGAAQTVLSVNKTTNVVTMGAAVTVPAGYAMILHATETTIAGILEDQPNTARAVGAAFVATDALVSVAREAVAVSSKITGSDAAVLLYLFWSGVRSGPWGYSLQPLIGTFMFSTTS